LRKPKAGSGRKWEGSPLLDQICHGGSAVALNLSRMAHLPKDKRLFLSEALNHTVIFKYPNFEDDISAGGGAALADKPAAKPAEPTPTRPNDATAPEGDAKTWSEKRPIETAIYIPNDPEDLKAGGYGIYLRQRDFDALLKRHIGLDLTQTTGEYEQDITALRAIDGIPSLDPFLLKSALAFCAERIHPEYFSITPDEEKAVREVIAQKLRPIVAKAIELENEAEIRNRTDAFLNSLWDPRLPEAGMFLRALGITAGDAREVIEGWKGVAYYKVTFDRVKDGVINLVKWLETEAGDPVDGRRQNKGRLQQQQMFRRAISERLRVVWSQMSEVFKRYDASHAELIGEGRPMGFRRFLENVHRYYWVLGYCSMSLRHCATVFERATANNASKRLTFDEIEGLLVRLRVSLNSQSDGML
jgi:hypothetical protein